MADLAGWSATAPSGLVSSVLTDERPRPAQPCKTAPGKALYRKSLESTPLTPSDAVTSSEERHVPAGSAPGRAGVRTPHGMAAVQMQRAFRGYYTRAREIPRLRMKAQDGGWDWDVEAQGDRQAGTGPFDRRASGGFVAVVSRPASTAEDARHRRRVRTALGLSPDPPLLLAKPAAQPRRARAALPETSALFRTATEMLFRFLLSLDTGRRDDQGLCKHVYCTFLRKAAIALAPTLRRRR